MKSINDILNKYELNGLINGCSTGSDWFSSGDKIESFSPVDGKLIASLKSGSDRAAISATYCFALSTACDIVNVD